MSNRQSTTSQAQQRRPTRADGTQDRAVQAHHHQKPKAIWNSQGQRPAAKHRQHGQLSACLRVESAWSYCCQLPAAPLCAGLAQVLPIPHSPTAKRVARKDCLESVACRFLCFACRGKALVSCCLCARRAHSLAGRAMVDHHGPSWTNNAEGRTTGENSKKAGSQTSMPQAALSLTLPDSLEPRQARRNYRQQPAMNLRQFAEVAKNTKVSPLLSNQAPCTQDERDNADAPAMGFGDWRA